MGRPPKNADEKLGKVIPLRLDQATEIRIQEVASKYSMPKSVIIRMLTDTFVNQAVGPNGEVTLPPNWKDLVTMEAAHRKMKYPKTKKQPNPPKK